MALSSNMLWVILQALAPMVYDDNLTFKRALMNFGKEEGL
jgi:hypothetical protein